MLKVLELHHIERLRRHAEWWWWYSARGAVRGGARGARAHLVLDLGDGADDLAPGHVHAERRHGLAQVGHWHAPTRDLVHPVEHRADLVQLCPPPPPPRARGGERRGGLGGGAAARPG